MDGGQEHTDTEAEIADVQQQGRSPSAVFSFGRWTEATSSGAPVARCCRNAHDQARSNVPAHGTLATADKVAIPSRERTASGSTVSVR